MCYIMYLKFFSYLKLNRRRDKMLKFGEVYNTSNLRKRVSVSFDPELLQWVDCQVEKNVEFKDRSHAIEVILTRYKEKVESCGSNK